MRQFANDIERLMALFRLQPVDRKDDFIRVGVSLVELIHVLPVGGDHRLVLVRIVFNRVVGKANAIGVFQFLANLRYGPMPGEASMTNPAENVPTDQPAGKCIVRLLLWTKRTGYGAIVVWTTESFED